MNFSPEKKNNQIEKQAKWSAIAGRVDRTKDKLGMGIDENIKEAIIGLTLFEVNTTGSCGGHADSLNKTPWIDIQPKEAWDKRKEIRGAKTDEEAKLLTDKYREEVEKLGLEEQKKISMLLDEFYSDRQSSFYGRLIIKSSAWGSMRLRSQGADLQKIEDEETRKVRLVEFQVEMKAFTEFLKNKFFNE